jgi:hypothetical protein
MSKLPMTSSHTDFRMAMTSIAVITIISSFLAPSLGLPLGQLFLLACRRQ